MGSEWPESRLDEITTLIVDCPHSTPEWTDSGIVVLRSNNIKGGRLDLSSPSYTNEAGYAARIKRAIPSEGDLVITREAPMGEVCQIPPGLRCCLGQRMVLLRTDPALVDSKYLLFALQSPYLQHQISWSEGTGTTVSNIRIPDLKAFLVPTPAINEQKQIANILGSLDDKIELNRQMNTTLEAMAQALFKSWFVDFDPVIDNALAAGNEIPEELAARAERRAKAAQRQSPERPHPLPAAIRQQFPDRFVFTDTMGWVPEGWSALSLSSAIQINPKVSLRKGHAAKYVDMKALPTSGYGIDEFVWKPYAGGAKFVNDDVLLARITPCLENGKTGLVDFLEDNEPGFGSTEFIVMRAKGAISPAYVACLARDTNFRLHCVSSMVGSSGRQRVQNACFDSYFVCVPEDEEVLKLFDARCSPNFEKMTALKNEAVSLASLRDTLLPKLLSGQLRIPEAEQLLAEVI